jgi:hypothetical protein
MRVQMAELLLVMRLGLGSMWPAPATRTPAQGRPKPQKQTSLDMSTGFMSQHGCDKLVLRHRSTCLHINSQAGHWASDWNPEELWWAQGAAAMGIAGC